MRAMVTVVGQDKIGIIAKLSQLLAEAKVNILDISQTILQEYFTMMMLVDLKAMKVELKELRKELDELGQSLGLSIIIQHEDIFRAMHRID
ncbi:MAG: ACT domain-containing protein [Spirochaetales bacterium]|nr:ACT domain-containing protein [Spirochaetales bacterium]